jgi:hypothetical protein
VAGAARKIQAICNGKCDANYNARSCKGDRKAAGAGTMASNGKNNAQSNQNSQNMARPAQPSDVRLGTPSRVPPRGHEKSPPISRGGRHSQKSEIRIPAIADLARKCKRKTKALPLFPRSAACGARSRARARQDTGTLPVLAFTSARLHFDSDGRLPFADYRSLGDIRAARRSSTRGTPRALFGNVGLTVAHSLSESP